MTRYFALPSMILLLTLLAGCQPELNHTPPASEAETLGTPIQLTHAFVKAGEAYFSADMKWIIFQACTKPDTDYEMYVAQTQWKDDQITGISTPIRISPEGSWNSCGNFSPDGNSLIFSSTQKPRAKEPPTPGYHWAMPPEAEIYRADNWKAALAAIEPGGSTDLAQHAITHNIGYDAECGYSPDGKWIVYCSKITGDADIWAMRSDGTRQIQLTHKTGYDGGPFFSPDGKRICYRSDRKGNSLLQIFTADLTFDEKGDISGIVNEQQLTDNTAVNWGPYWHPDKTHIIWARTLHNQGNFELFLMRDDGSHKTQITFSNGFNALPVFSPDGNWLMWTSTRAKEKTSQIWIAPFKMPRGS
jgi:TolB protein